MKVCLPVIGIANRQQDPSGGWPLLRRRGKEAPRGLVLVDRIEKLVDPGKPIAFSTEVVHELSDVFGKVVHRYFNLPAQSAIGEVNKR